MGKQLLDEFSPPQKKISIRKNKKKHEKNISKNFGDRDKRIDFGMLEEFPFGERALLGVFRSGK